MYKRQDYDIILREEDIVYIPEYVNTVKISGSVMYPNTVTWEKGAKLKHYINMAGGYGAVSYTHLQRSYGWRARLPVPVRFVPSACAAAILSPCMDWH